MNIPKTGEWRKVLGNFLANKKLYWSTVAILSIFLVLGLIFLDFELSKRPPVTIYTDTNI